MKQSIVTALLALVAVVIVFIILMGRGHESKKVVNTSKASKDSVEPMKNTLSALIIIHQHFHPPCPLRLILVGFGI